ncbi:porimin [Rhinatrema bivittatum]|uniref:porimin n=1 Tax=Rhinatrema bivittatum TaxID=194408 RepID=UPI001128CCC4|nr:porimin [Rhinatrema bivittatum]
MKPGFVQSGRLLLALAVIVTALADDTTTKPVITSISATTAKSLSTSPNVTISPSNVTTSLNISTASISTTTERKNTTEPTPATKGGATTNSTVSITTAPTRTTNTTNSLATSTGTVDTVFVHQRTSRFDVGSFVGGIILTLGILVVLYLGCRFYSSRRGVRYRTIDEHEAII